MNSFWQNLAVVCVVLAASELVGQLCSKNAMVGFVRALAVLVLLGSTVSSLFSLNWDFSQPMRETNQAGEELSGLVVERTAEAARKETERYLEGLLETAGLRAEKIEAFTDIGEDGSIVLTKASVTFLYESDSQRAWALLTNTLGDETEVEVKTDGR